MAFDKEPTRTPMAIRRIVITLEDGVITSTSETYQTANFEIQIELSDGSAVTRRGNLVPHITAGQRQGLLDFMANLRAQAEAEIL